MRMDVVWALALFGAVVVTAAIVNAVAPSQRVRVRRIVILFILYLVVLAVHEGLEVTHVAKWATRAEVATDLLQAFTIVNIVATLTFSVLMPKVRVAVPMIASDLAVGVGYILTTLACLSGHGLDPSSVLATSAVVSAVLAISLQSTLGNILGGVALQLDGSIHEGDWIMLENGKQGRVRQVRWRHTVVETRDWSTIIVPNVALLGSNITILGKRDGREVPQRMWVWFNVDFRYMPGLVIKTVTDAVCAAPIDGVAADPRPNCVCMDFTKDMRESYATYAVRYWLTDLAADDPTNSRVRQRVFAALRRAGIPLARPAQTAFVELQDSASIERHDARKLSERRAAITSMTLFRNLTDAERETLAKGISHVIYSPNEVMTRQGAVAHWLYVMTKGSAEVRANVDVDGPGPKQPQTKVIATLNAPDFFGEMGLMTGEPRVADVVAVTDVECFRLEKETFRKVLTERPEIAEELSDLLAARRVNLISRRDNLDEDHRVSFHASERDRILGSIKEFFGL